MPLENLLARKEKDMKRVVIKMVDHGLRIAVRETEDPATWELELPGVAEEGVSVTY